MSPNSSSQITANTSPQQCSTGLESILSLFHVRVRHAGGSEEYTARSSSSMSAFMFALDAMSDGPCAITVKPFGGANLKHQARAMKNPTGEKLSHCQQAIAKNHGYATLAALQAAVKDSPQEVQTPALDQLP